MRQIGPIAKHEPDEWSDAWHLRQLVQPSAAVRCTRRSNYYSLTCEASSPMVPQLAPSGRAGCQSFQTISRHVHARKLTLMLNDYSIG